MVDGMEEGAAVVPEGVRVGGLDEGTIVIHKTFNKGGHSRSLVRGGGWGKAWRGVSMGSSMWCSIGCGGRDWRVERKSAMSRPVSVAEQK